MLSRPLDPIIAIATAQGRGAVGIVRLSGKNLAPFVRAWLGCDLRAREATYLPFPDAQGAPIDQGLALYFPAPHSFTGEDVLELQAHGGPVVLQLLLARCLAFAQVGAAPDGRSVLPYLRLAQPGEFTERAFMNSKIDLAQAEAIADLIDASTEAAARSATASLSGVFSQHVNALRDALVRLRMLVEATLDFPEEEIDFLQRADAQGQLSRLQAQLHTLQAQATQGALLREGIQVVIAGQPNAGKSSLLNALAGAELAIVTPIAGTTRDKVEQTIQIQGVPVHVVDTAGLRESTDEVEKIGISRAWDAIEGADAVLFLHDLTRRSDAAYALADAQIAQLLAQKLGRQVPVIDVWNKADVVADMGADTVADVATDIATDAAVGPSSSASGIRLSAKTGAGLEALRAALLHAAGWQAPTGGLFIARERHVQALRRVDAHVHEAVIHLANNAQALDLLAEELRLAQNALNEITGVFGSDDLLGVIFSSFCIGK
jgi:tRNA modification GTPase